MKKTYIAPLTEDVTVKVGEIICATISMSGSAAANNVSVADAKRREAADEYREALSDENAWETGIW